MCFLIKLIVKCSAIGLLLLSTALQAQEVGITIDDPNLERTPMLDPADRDKKILTALKHHHIKAALFVRGRYIDNQGGAQLLQRWNQAGHLIGNHTYSHWNLNDKNLAEYEADTLKNEMLLQSYSRFKKIFRYPFLKEGNTLAKRDGFRDFLRAHHYEMGSVTIDASDWYISDRLEKRLAQNPRADITPYKKYYLKHMWERAQYYDNLAKAVIGRSPKHTLLIHHNLLNALFLDDLIQLFKDKGWTVINAEVAFQDPLYKITPNTLPAGESLIWSLAKQSGRYNNKLRYPGEDGVYEKEEMNQLGL